MSYRIWCRVSGGITGTREAWLKERGVVKEFGSFAEADTEARRLMKEMRDLCRTAYFQYTAIEMEADDAEWKACENERRRENGG